MSSCSSCTSSAQFSIKAYQQQQQKSQIDPSQQSQKDAGHTAHLDNDFAKGDALNKSGDRGTALNVSA